MSRPQPSTASASELCRLSLLACFLLVLLRMSIGWQLLYEGMWKLARQGTAQPWSAAGYLKNAQGPFRDKFRALADDPDDLNWLDPDAVARRWDQWYEAFVAHYELTDDQVRRLDGMLNGPKGFSVRLEQLPEGVTIGGSLARVVRYDADAKRLVLVDRNYRMLPRERDALLRLVTVEENPAEEDREQNDLARAWQEAVRKLYEIQSRLSYKEKVRAWLAGDPENAGLKFWAADGSLIEAGFGDVARYHEALKRYEQRRAEARTEFQWEHLDRQWQDLQALRAKLVGPVRALDEELKEKAQALLTTEQLARGPVPLPATTIDRVNLLTMWSLTILGGLLIAGLFSRLAALGAAGLIFLFYLAMPPWPGVPELPGPEHSFIVNKNLIEVIALLALAAMPTGRWFGVDALFGGWRRRAD